MTEPSLAATVALMSGRRSNLRIDPNKPVSPELIDQLCRAAVAAPNHKLTEPWRFAVLTGAARTTLGEIAVEARRSKGDTDPGFR